MIYRNTGFKIKKNKTNAIGCQAILIIYYLFTCLDKSVVVIGPTNKQNNTMIAIDNS